MDVSFDDSHIILANDQNQEINFLKLLQHHLQDFMQEKVIFRGDFNCSLSDKDRKGK